MATRKNSSAGKGSKASNGPAKAARSKPAAGKMTAAEPAPVSQMTAVPQAAPRKAGAVGQIAQSQPVAAAPVSVSPAPEVRTVLNHDQIARRAYEIWIAKGRPVGLDEQNWREAEAQLQAEGRR